VRVCSGLNWVSIRRSGRAKGQWNFSVRKRLRMLSDLRRSKYKIIDFAKCSKSGLPMIYIFFFWRCDPTRPMASSFLWLLDHTQRRTTVGRTALNKWSACRWDLYLTAHNAHKRQSSVPPTRFETTISVGKRPHAYISMIHTRKIFTSNTIWSVTYWRRRQYLSYIHFEYWGARWRSG
jgi:hypothetical protein